jgi:mono/diheme cytochrome c family protein
MRGMRVLLAAAVILAIPVPHGHTQDIGQPGRGLESANRLCAQCHAVRKDRAQSPNEHAPRFQAVAAVSGMTALALSAAINTSHREMPNILLDANDQADIIAYILSLK